MRIRFGIFPSPAVEDLEVTMTAVEAADEALKNAGADRVDVERRERQGRVACAGFSVRATPD